MVELLRKYEENGEQIEEYTRDGETVSHTVRTLIMDDSMIEEVAPEPSIEEQILTETKYQTVLLEMNTGL
ncbi:hypothetical protein [Kurthia sp. Dielmo]|uniref:hypothetical protein n=1 Tax=Kurthia sp. Dielmo TaxID=1033738 RepID=UPI0002E5D9B7|nr:hypothetical protein [Kurthia sp. Dielmo]